MKRNSTSSMGAMHPVFFLITVYAVSVFLAFFVCNVVYNSLHKADSMAGKNVSAAEHYTALK